MLIFLSVVNICLIISIILIVTFRNKQNCPDPKPCSICPQPVCPDPKPCSICPQPVCPQPVCPQFPKTYPYSNATNFPIGVDIKLAPCKEDQNTYSQLLLSSLSPPTANSYIPGGDDKNPTCESGDILQNNNVCQNKGGLVSSFLAGYDNDSSVCAHTYHIGKSGQIYQPE